MQIKTGNAAIADVGWAYGIAFGILYFSFVGDGNKERIIVSKDSKGDPSIFELKVNVNYIVSKEGENLINNKISKKTTYNNITDKFELESYEKTIIDNLVSEISDNIILSISIISE